MVPNSSLSLMGTFGNEDGYFRSMPPGALAELSGGAKAFNPFGAFSTFRMEPKSKRSTNSHACFLVF